MEHRLHEPALLSMRAILFGQQPVKEHAMTGWATHLPALAVLSLAGHQHMLNVVGIVDEKRRRDDTQTGRLTVPPMTVHEKTQTVSGERPPMADEGKCRRAVFDRGRQ